MVSGLSHLTLSVADLERSIAFYRDLLGLRLEASWDRGAYLAAGGLWLCLALASDAAVAPAQGYTHYAFALERDAFAQQVALLRRHGVPEWQSNRSEGASLYVLDPDGHRLELHVGDLAARLAHCRRHPYPGMRFHA